MATHSHVFSVCAIPCVLSCVSPVASYTFYSAHSDVPELTPQSGLDDNIISFAHLDTPPDSQLSGMGPADELTGLNVSAHTSDGFDLSWELKPPAAYDSLVVECRGPLQTLAVMEVVLSGNSTRSRIRGLNASTEYRITLHGITGSNGSLLLEAIAVTVPEPTSPGLIMNVTDVLTTTTTTTASTATTATPTTATSTRPQSFSETAPVPTIVVSHTLGSPPVVGTESPLTEPFGAFTLTNMSSTSVGVSWSAPDQTFDHFLVELSSPSEEAPARTTMVAGSEGGAEIEGLSPSTRYEITLYGLVEGVRSQPLKMFVDTGT
ncbi:tenascin-like [Gadus morhua]|uniref:tenascin-like n=1 Tax=Gadus morhua TaxID=8049 RepID=UPI0011B75F09|nr:tenascin-like [Gadus morhua]